MKKSILLFICIAALSFVTASAQSRPEWLSGVKIDGKITEWGNSLHYYDKTSTMRYGFANDSANLYLAFLVVEPAGQMRIMRGGLNISLKTRLKPKINGMLHLIGQKPDKESIDEMSQTRMETPANQRRDNRLEILKNIYLMAKPNIETSGFVHSKEMLTSGEGGIISFQVAWTNLNQMAIECKIPLSELFGENFNLSQISTKEIQLTINQAEKENRGGPGGGFHAGMGGGGRMGGEYGRNSGMGDLNEPYGDGGDARPSFQGYSFDEIDIKNNISLSKGK